MLAAVPSSRTDAPRPGQVHHGLQLLARAGQLRPAVAAAALGLGLAHRKELELGLPVIDRFGGLAVGHAAQGQYHAGIVARPRWCGQPIEQEGGVGHDGDRVLLQEHRAGSVTGQRRPGDGRQRSVGGDETVVVLGGKCCASGSQTRRRRVSAAALGCRATIASRH